MNSTQAMNVGPEAGDDSSYEVIAADFEGEGGADEVMATAESLPTMPKLRRRVRSALIVVRMRLLATITTGGADVMDAFQQRLDSGTSLLLCALGDFSPLRRLGITDCPAGRFTSLF